MPSNEPRPFCVGVVGVVCFGVVAVFSVFVFLWSVPDSSPCLKANHDAIE